MVDPAKLAWGRGRAAKRGVGIDEGRAGRRASPPVPASMSTPGDGVVSRPDELSWPPTCFPPWSGGPPLHRARLRLRADDRTAHRRAARLARLGSRQGVGDRANQFHYYRLSADNRILWGGYDAIYHYGRRVEPEPATSALRRSTGWLGTSSRPSPSSRACGSATSGAGRSTPPPGSARSRARAHGGRVAYVSGSPASGSARPGSAPRSCSTCSTAPDRTTGLAMVREKPLPFPRNRWPTPASSSPGGRWPGPTARRAAQPVAAGPGPAGLGFDS